MDDNINAKKGWWILAAIVVALWYVSFFKNSDRNKPKVDQGEGSQSAFFDNVIDLSDSRPLQRIIGKKATFRSTTNDLEVSNTVIQTNKEITYHTFDFESMTVINKSKLNGQWITLQYPMIAFYSEKGTLATTYVIGVHMLGVKEIWYSPDVPNLGYDYDDGSRMAFYNLTKM